jgi:hypothetical protein
VCKGNPRPEQMDSKYNISMPPDVWGPIFWNTMHIVSLGYSVQPTDAEKAGMKAFFESLAVTIPCPVCRQHYSELIKESPVDAALGSKGELIFWVWDIHNRVNKILEKPEVSIDEFMNRMRGLAKSERAMRGWGTTELVLAGVVGVAAGAAAYWAYQKYGK